MTKEEFFIELENKIKELKEIKERLNKIHLSKNEEYDCLRKDNTKYAMW